MPIKRASQKAKSDHVFGQPRRPAKMSRAGLYARVSSSEQQTLAMQNRAMREYAARRGWTVAIQVREANLGAARRSEKRANNCWKWLAAGRSIWCRWAPGRLGPVRNGPTDESAGTGSGH